MTTGRVLALFILLLFLLYALFPLGRGLFGTLVVNGELSIEHYRDIFLVSSDSTWEAVANSVLVSLLTVLLGGLLGSFNAFVLTQISFSGRRLAAALAAVPIGMPPLVGVIAFLFVFGEGGFLPRLLGLLIGSGESVAYLDGIPAIVAIHVYAFHVYFYLMVSAALRGLDQSQLEAASILGASTTRVVVRVIVPQLRPALLAAASLAFMASMASFSAPFLFGGGQQFLTTLIYSTKLNGDLDLAGALSALLTAVSLAFFLILSVALRAEQTRFASKGSVRTGVLRTGKIVRRVALSIFLLILFVELLPMLMVVLISFAREGSWTWQLLPQELTLLNYQRLLTDDAVFEPMQNSVVMSFIVVVAAGFLGTGAAHLLTKGVLRKARSFLDTVLSIPFALPGTVVAIYLILTFSAPRLWTGNQVLLGSFWILPLAYFIRTYPMVVRSVSSAFDRLDDSLLEASAMFGAGPFHGLRTVVLPMILPGIVSGVLLVLITSLGEFPSSILLYTHANRPVAIEILSQLRGYNFGGAAAYSVFLLVLILVLTSAANRVVHRR
jgi:iron(III) transport system permease protein